MPYFADTHAHIYVEEFDADREDIAQRAFNANVQAILLPNIDSSTTAAMKQTANMDARFHPMMGIHPCSIKPPSYKDELKHVLTELDSSYQSQHGKGYCAVGEIGIDLYWDRSTLKIQVESFEQQMLWAFERHLPVAVHCRDAYSEVISSISNMGPNRPKGVLHCFTGTIEQANSLIDLGFLLGIGGVLTFKNSGLDKVVQQIDLQHLVLETDSPYLAPTPHRGTRNEPSYIPIIANKIADVKGIDPFIVMETTTQTAHDLFAW